MDRSRFGMERLRRSFWFLPTTGVLAGLVVGLATTSIDAWLGLRLPLFEDTDADSARSMLGTIATATLSVAGVTFSVTVVALQLASSQLNPRILRTFQADRMSQVTLAAFLGAFTLSLATIVRLPTAGRASDLGVAVAVIAVIAALILFAAFIHHIVVSLQASTLIHRSRSTATVHSSSSGPEASARSRPTRSPPGCRPSTGWRRATR